MNLTSIRIRRVKKLIFEAVESQANGNPLMGARQAALEQAVTEAVVCPRQGIKTADCRTEINDGLLGAWMAFVNDPDTEPEQW